MMTKSKEFAILIVDDEPDNLRVLDEHFQADYHVLTASSGNEALGQLASEKEIAAIIMDIKMSGMDGLETAREIRKTRPEIPIIFNTAYPGDYDENEIDASEKPYDYIEKLDESNTKLTRAVRNAVDHYRMLKEDLSLVEFAEKTYGMHGISDAMQNVFLIMRKVAPTNLHLIIQGATGTGKKTVARNIHKTSPRARKPIVHCPCREKSARLQAQELFGGEEAARQLVGLFDQSDGGTVILEDIDSINLDVQTKILRLIERGNLNEQDRRRDLPYDVRIIGTCQNDLKSLVEEGGFREDLYYRLASTVINLPPLKERRQDIPILIEKYKSLIEQETGLPQKIFNNQAIEMLSSYDWPGNVRQLLATVENIAKTSSPEMITEREVAAKLELKPVDKEFPKSDLSLSEQVRAFEKSRIMEVLKKNDFNVSAAARELQIDRANLYKKFKYYQINIPK